MNTPDASHAPAVRAASRITATPLTEADIDPLSSLLWHEDVYRHIGGLPDAPTQVAQWLRGALAGAPPGPTAERWLNYALRLPGSGAHAGLLQATLHDGLAEVAFLLAPSHWGQGLAAEALQWLHGELARVSPGTPCWATTLPANERSRRLLERCGYVRVDPPASPVLVTYDEGDWVFRRV